MVRGGAAAPFRVVEDQAVVHGRRVLDAHEVEVPAAVVRDHEEAQEDVRKEHLDLPDKSGLFRCLRLRVLPVELPKASPFSRAVPTYR